MSEAVTARVVMIGNRFLCGFGKIGQIKTAWSLSGAKMYPSWKDKEFDKDTLRLRRKEKDYIVCTVALKPEGWK